MFYSRTVLPSGIRILTERMPEVRSASIGFWVGIGSRDEPPGLQGASHFLEHLLFKGSTSRSSREISEAFDAVGGDANAEALKDYTVFHARVLDKDLEMATEVLTDILTDARLDSQDFESERKVVLEEIAAHEDSPEDVVHELFALALFGDHPLGREVLGTNASVGAMDVEGVRTFFKDNYFPANIVVAAAGSVDHGALAGSIESAFGEGAGPASAAPARTPPVFSPASRVLVRNRDSEQAHVLLGGLGYSRHHPDRFAWGVLDDLMGGGSSSRLFQEIREERGLAYTVYSYRNQFADTGFYGVYGGTDPDRAGDLLQVAGEILDRLHEGGVSEAELERAKGRFRGGLALGLEDPASRMARLGRSELVHTEILSIDELIARIDAVTIGDVNRVAADLLGRESRVLAVVGPFDQADFPGWAADG